MLSESTRKVFRPRPGYVGGLLMEAGRRGTARIGVLTIIDEEFEEARSILPTPDHVPGTAYYTNGLDRLDVVLRQAPDRANIPATNSAMRMMEEFRPEVLAVVGIAGGVHGRDDVQLGDVIVASYLHYGEFRKLGGSGDLQRYFAYDQPAVSIRETTVDPVRRDGVWAARIQATRPVDGAPKVIVGSIVAGEKVLGDPTHEEQRLVVRRFSDAVGVDMESVGVARSVHEARRSVDYNPLLLVVRGVSDHVRVDPPDPDQAEEENAAERALWKRYAASAAAAFGAEVVDAILRSTDLRSTLRGAP